MSWAWASAAEVPASAKAVSGAETQGLQGLQGLRTGCLRTGVRAAVWDGGAKRSSSAAMVKLLCRGGSGISAPAAQCATWVAHGVSL
jgi:hypothetical protein